MQNKEISQLKNTVYNRFEKVINDKVRSLEMMLDDLIESTRNETKSSAGDKYETGRAMLQIEQDNARQQLQKAIEQKAEYEKTDLATGNEMVKKGSLVKTNAGYFFITVALGKLKIEDSLVIAISPYSPLGSKLIGLKKCDSTTINEITYLIEEIC